MCGDYHIIQWRSGKKNENGSQKISLGKEKWNPKTYGKYKHGQWIQQLRWPYLVFKYLTSY